jgi:hypothetical protein
LVHEVPGDIDTDLSQILKNHPELAKLIETWPDVSPELRAAILRMILK